PPAVCRHTRAGLGTFDGWRGDLYPTHLADLRRGAAVDPGGRHVYRRLCRLTAPRSPVGKTWRACLQGACRGKETLGTMRIGLFGDIHGNLVALDAVLDALQRERPDHLICLGDVATTGPWPHEVTARVGALGCPIVRGNWDDWMLEIRDGRRSPAGCRPMD